MTPDPFFLFWRILNLLNYSYYPFKNKLENIGEEDLLLLREVSEGWYIDYKSQGLKIKDSAKHLAAFANQYGGWLIIGVNENNDGSRTASDFIGIANEDLEKVTRDIREASAAHVNPEVLYEEKIVMGPLDGIGLIKGRSIVIIGVPMSHSTPHIHSSGQIFRRLADQSKPKEENDRYILDDLWRRGMKHQGKMAEFLKNPPELPYKQSDSSWAYINFKPSDGQVGQKNKLGFVEFSDLAMNVRGCISGVNAPMDAVNSTIDGYIARQIKGNDPSSATLSLRWWHDGRARLSIPLNEFDLNRFTETHKQNHYAEEFSLLAKELGYSQIRIIDYSMLAQAIASLTNLYLHALIKAGDRRDIYSSFMLKNVLYTSPYTDSLKFISRAREFSLPLTIDKEIVFPGDPSEATMLFHKGLLGEKPLEYSGKINYIPYVFSSSLIFKIFQAVGIADNYKEFSNDTEAWGFHKLSNHLPNQ